MGFEPTTWRLQVACASSCATPASGKANGEVRARDSPGRSACAGDLLDRVASRFLTHEAPVQTRSDVRPLRQMWVLVFAVSAVSPTVARATSVESHLCFGAERERMCTMVRRSSHLGGVRMTWRRLCAVLAIGSLTGLPLIVTAPPAGASGTANYSCSLSLGGRTQTFTSSATITASAAPSYTKGQEANLTGFQSQFTIPASIVQQWDNSGIDWVEGEVSIFKIDDTSAKVHVVNVARNGFDIGKKTLPNPARAITLTAPTAPKTVGTWKVVKKGTMDFETGDVSETLTDNLPINFHVSCTASPPTTIASSTVS